MLKYQERIIYKDENFRVQYRKAGLFTGWHSLPPKFKNRLDAEQFMQDRKMPDEYTLSVGKQMRNL